MLRQEIYHSMQKEGCVNKMLRL